MSLYQRDILKQDKITIQSINQKVYKLCLSLDDDKKGKSMDKQL